MEMSHLDPKVGILKDFRRKGSVPCPWNLASQSRWLVKLMSVMYWHEAGMAQMCHKMRTHSTL